MSQTSASFRLPAAKKKILLVDANIPQRTGRAGALRKLGVEVVCASGLVEARLLWHPKTYDLVLVAANGDPSAAGEFGEELRREEAQERVAYFVGGPRYLAARPEATAAPCVAVAPPTSAEGVKLLVKRASAALPRRGGILEAAWRISVLHLAVQSPRPTATPEAGFDWGIGQRLPVTPIVE